MNRWLNGFILGGLLCGMVGCSANYVSPIPSTEPSPPKTDNIESLKALTAGSSKGVTEEIGAIRYQAIQEEALSLGAQGGLAARAKVINYHLEQNAKYLNQVFNFHLLLLPCSILPPVLVEGRQELNLDDNTTIRIADRTYAIAQQARFVTTPPNWREYLFLNFKQPDVPDNSLLPKTGQEKIVWNKFLVQGWNDGINQANTIYADSLARLKRDYSGMVRYRKLLAQHMVTAPYVAKTDLGITCDGSGMRVNDQVLRITALPRLCTNSKKWKPAITHENGCATCE